MGKNRETVKLLDAVTANTTGTAVQMEATLSRAYTLIISGITTATVKILGGHTSATMALMGGGEFTADGSMVISTQFPFIRADVEGYSAGTITVELGY